jgi:hypothetical protein
LFALKDEPSTDSARKRPRQTLSPLSQLFGIAIDHGWTFSQVPQLLLAGDKAEDIA